MTEFEAREWLTRLGVSRETFERLDLFLATLRDEAGRQNLIARSTLDQLWSRHVVDSAQLLPLADGSGPWVDIGSGAGFPGMVVALISERALTLVEPRRRRAEFLQRVVDELGLAARVSVQPTSMQRVRSARLFGVVSARAVASLEQLFAMGSAVTSDATVWIAPKGRTAAAELEAARRTWHGDFALVPSITDPDAGIVVARRVRPRKA